MNFVTNNLSEMEDKVIKKVESNLYKINKIYMVIAGSVSEAEQVFKRHYPNLNIEELKRIGKVLM